MSILGACDAPKLPFQHVGNDTVISKSYNNHYGLVYTLGDIGSTMYVVYGKDPTGQKEGVAVTPDHKFLFSIKELVDKHPELDSKKVQEAEERQSKYVSSSIQK